MYYLGHKVHYVEPMFVVVIMTVASSRPILKMFELLMWKLTQFFGGSLEAWWLVILTTGPLLGSLITEAAAMTISACLLADKFYDLNPGRRLKYATLALLFVNVSVGGTLTSFAAPPVMMVAEAWGWGSLHMLSHFGWKAVIGITLTNALYFFAFRKSLRELKQAYAVQSFKKHIQRRFINTEDLEERLDQIEYEMNQKLGFTQNFSQVCAQLKDEIHSDAEEHLSVEEKARYDVVAVLDQRFEDIKHDEMRKAVPGLLPKEKRPFYRDPNWDNREDWVPKWMMVWHVLFMIWTVANAHEPVLFIGGFMFHLGFTQVTAGYQNRINLKPALMVAFFLAGLVIHGGLQGWWIAPILRSLGETQLMLGAISLTAFNDNAAITNLSTLVTGFSPELKYAVVSGAIAGGGLTIIANAPNPAGQSILKRYFENGISPVSLLRAAAIPTLIVSLCLKFL